MLYGRSPLPPAGQPRGAASWPSRVAASLGHFKPLVSSLSRLAAAASPPLSASESESEPERGEREVRGQMAALEGKVSLERSREERV